MLVGGDVIAVKDKNYLFCGLLKKQTEFNIKMVVHNDYFSLSSHIEEIKEDATNNVLCDTVVLYTVNEELEMDENSKETYLYVNLFDDSIRVKHIDNIVDYLNIWRTKVQLLNKGNKPKIPDLMDMDMAMTLLENERIKNKNETLFVFKNFLTDLLVMYENIEYYEKIKDYWSQYNVVEKRRCLMDVNVFRDGNKFLFIHKGAVLSLYASVDISDIKGCALALAKHSKNFHEGETLIKVLGD